MAYPIDVAVLDAEGHVLRTTTLRPPWGMTFWRWRARTTLEAPAGALAQWGVHVGSRLEVGSPS